MDNQTKNRILIGTTEVCGLIKMYGTYLRQNDYEVTTVDSYNENVMFSDEYDVNLDRIGNFIIKSKSIFFNPIKIILSKLNNNFQFLFKGILTKKLIDNHDVFIFIWGKTSLFFDNSDLDIIKRKGKKIVYLLMGSDVRFIEAFEQRYNVDMKSQWGHAPNYRMSLNKNLKIIRRIEKYSDAIFSVPDQSLMAIRPYDHLYLPILMEDYNYSFKENDIPNILHCPSNPSKKGTDTILKVVAELKKEGYKFNFEYKTQIAHSEVKLSLEKANILIDELNGLGPGMLSLEGMASGCVVLTRCERSELFDPPVISVTKENLKQELIRVLNMNFSTQKKISEKGLYYVKEYHEVGNNLDRLFRKMNTPDNYDYHPDYFSDHFINNHGNIDEEIKREAKEVIMMNGVKSKSVLTNLLEKNYIADFTNDEKTKIKYYS